MCGRWTWAATTLSLRKRQEVQELRQGPSESVNALRLPEGMRVIAASWRRTSSPSSSSRQYGPLSRAQGQPATNVNPFAWARSSVFFCGQATSKIGRPTFIRPRLCGRRSLSYDAALSAKKEKSRDRRPATPPAAGSRGGDGGLGMTDLLAAIRLPDGVKLR